MTGYRVFERFLHLIPAIKSETGMTLQRSIAKQELARVMSKSGIDDIAQSQHIPIPCNLSRYVD